MSDDNVNSKVGGGMDVRFLEVGRKEVEADVSRAPG